MRTSAVVMFFLFSLTVFFIPVSASVIINEINPWGSSGEWIEIYNAESEPINISGWTIDTASYKKDLAFPENAVLESGAYFVAGDSGCGADYEENITITDTNVSVTLRDKDGQIIDQASFGSFFKREDSLSIQRNLPDVSLSNGTIDWTLASPTKGQENFPLAAVLEIAEILGPQEIFVNDSALLNVSVLNKGPEDAKDIGLELNSTSGYSKSVVLSVLGNSTENVSFEWAPELAGNFTFCAYSDNLSLCRDFFVKARPEKLAVLEVAIGDSLKTYEEYDSLFKVEIENKSQIDGSCSGKDNVTVGYNISSFSGSYNFSDNVSLEVGCSKTSGTGKWTPLEAGNYILCGWIIDSTTKFKQTPSCKNISVASMEEIPCNLTILLESKLALNDGESGSFNITVRDSLAQCIGCPVEITYSLENSSGSFLAGYPKATNKTIGGKNIFSFTPSLDCGSAVYTLRANISEVFCNDSSLEDNSANIQINLTGKTVACPVVQAKETKKTSLVSGSGGGGGISTSSTTAKSKSDPVWVEIAYLKDEVAAGEEFFSRLSIKNNGNYSIIADVYSYAYDGKSCITGSWTNNQVQVSILKGETKEVSLKNKIEESAKSGNYIFRARVKLDGKNYDTDGSIMVTDQNPADGAEEIAGESAGENETTFKVNLSQPELRIWNDTKLRINLTNCDGCIMEIFGPNTNATTDKKYRVFDQKGIYNVLVTRNGSILLNQTYEFTNTSLKNSPNDEGLEDYESDDSSDEETLTGNFANTAQSGGFFGKIGDFLKGVFSSILSLMSSSIAK